MSSKSELTIVVTVSVVIAISITLILGWQLGDWFKKSDDDESKAMPLSSPQPAPKQGCTCVKKADDLPDILWWRIMRRLMGDKGAEYQSAFVDEACKRVDQHFDRPGVHEVCVVRTLVNLKDSFPYGFGLHVKALQKSFDCKTAEHVVNGDVDSIMDGAVRRACIATDSCLERIMVKDKPLDQSSPDTAAVITLVSFYRGFVVTFASAAGFRTALSEDSTDIYGPQHQH